MRRTTVLLLSFLVGLSPVLAGKLYKWVDRDGNVSYHDQPPPEGSGYRVEEKQISTGEKPKKKTDPNAKVAEKFPVVMYTATKCDSCNLARAYLDRRKVPYTEKNVESDLKLQEELKKKTGSLTVPTIFVGEKVMRGYLESLLEGELDAAGYARLETPESANGKPGEKNGDTK